MGRRNAKKERGNTERARALARAERESRRRPRRFGPVVGVVVLASVFAAVAVDPGGSLPGLDTGPGVTVDESFNVQQGVRLVLTLPEWFRGGLTLTEVFGEPEDVGPNPPVGYHLPDHPPLGRLWLGVFHQIGLVVYRPVEVDGPFVTACARLGSCVAFGLTVLLIGVVATEWYGPFHGYVAAFSLMLMPRLFGHAHLAALETVLNLAWTASVLAIACWWRDDEGVRPRAAVWAGVVFGLLLLTKIQAILLPLPVAVWAVWRWRKRALTPLAIWLGTGLAVFFVGWPWLWLDPVGHFGQYFGSATDRVALKVTYLGRTFFDRDVPWHYPFVMFLVTVPVVLHVLGFIGLRPRNVSDRVKPELQPSRSRLRFPWEERLVLVAGAFPLFVFAIPGVAVYDGVRLFLIAFPLWAIFIGRGSAVIIDWASARWPQRGRWSSVFVTALVLPQLLWAGLIEPAYLSSYNVLVGGTWGAERLGFQTTYWGDPVTRDLLEAVAEDVPRDSVIDFAPALHRFHAETIVRQSPVLRRRGITLRGFDPQRADVRYLLVFDRRCDLPDDLDERLVDARLIAEEVRWGVRLAAAYELTLVNGETP